MIVLLTAAGWRPSEIHELLMSLRSVSPYQVDKWIHSAQYMLRDLERGMDMIPYESVRSPMPRVSVSSTSPPSGLGEKVSQLVRDEAGLGAEEAASELSLRLARAHKTKADLVPPLSRKSFVSWVDRLASVFPASEILHVATKIRNERVHSGALDWSLRKYEP
jgi:hypothetical protein